jgi:hypothetical protein
MACPPSALTAENPRSGFSRDTTLRMAVAGQAWWSRLKPLLPFWKPVGGRHKVDSVEIAAAGLQLAKQRTVVHQLPDDQVQHLALALHHPLHAH